MLRDLVRGEKVFMVGVMVFSDFVRLKIPGTGLQYRYKQQNEPDSSFFLKNN
jgi:hypothetical protein